MLRKFLEFEIREYTPRTGDYSDWDSLYYWDADPATADTIHPEDLKKFAREVVDNIDHDDHEDDPDYWETHDHVEYEFRITLWQETTECEKFAYYSEDREALDTETWTEDQLSTLLDD